MSRERRNRTVAAGFLVFALVVLGWIGWRYIRQITLDNELIAAVKRVDVVSAPY